MHPKPTPRSSREVALPAEALASLRRALRREAGALATVHALHDAGHATGGSLFDAFAGGGDPAKRGEGAFWRALSAFLARKGWGSVEHEAVHEGIGVLSSADWAEAAGDGVGDESQPSCAFGTGLLSGFLSRAADGPVAVLEVSCRSRGDERCAFAFGSEEAVHALYGHLVEGRALDGALAGL